MVLSMGQPHLQKFADFPKKKKKSKNARTNPTNKINRNRKSEQEVKAEVFSKERENHSQLNHSQV